MHILNTRPSLKTRLALATCLLSGLALPARAQTAAPPSAGSILQQVTPPASLPVAPGPGIAITPPGQQALPANVSVSVSDVVISGNTLIPSATLQALLAPVRGRRVTLAALDQAVGRITAAYQAKGYMLAYAYLPPQSIVGGIVHVAVVEPRYDRVFVAGKSRLRASVAAATVGVTRGEPVTQDQLNRGLLLLDQTPGVLHVQGELIPGATPGTTSLQLTPQDEPLLSGDISQSDYGSHDTGTYLTSATVTANDPFGYGSSLGVNALLADGGRLQAGGAQATSPVLYDGVRAGLYTSSTDYRLGSAFDALGEVGRATLLGGDVTAPVLLAPRYALNLRFDVSNEWLAQSTRSVAVTSRQSIPTERLSASGAYADNFSGVTSANVSLTHGDVAIGPLTSKLADATGAKTAGGFDVVQLQLQRAQDLSRGFALVVDFSGQLADKDLDSSQKFYLGGPYGVMGYPVGDGGGDDGYLLTAKLSHALPVVHLPGALSAALLAQTGTVRVNHTPYPGFTGDNLLTESGIGPELDYLWRGWTFDVSYEHQLGANSSPLVSTRTDQAWFQLTYAF
jgi:hemolysin activation/secretion protein